MWGGGGVSNSLNIVYEYYSLKLSMTAFMFLFQSNSSSCIWCATTPPGCATCAWPRTKSSRPSRTPSTCAWRRATAGTTTGPCPPRRPRPAAAAAPSTTSSSPGRPTPTRRPRAAWRGRGLVPCYPRKGLGTRCP